MSWRVDVEQPFEIVTGDGEIYSFVWFSAQKNKEYNTSEFDFIGKEGTLVDRFRPRGRRYSLDVALQGEDHLEQAETFEQSADDPRPWTVRHPYYGEFVAQPLSLSFDNTGHGVTKITGDIVETIEDDSPSVSTDVTTELEDIKTGIDDQSVEAFSATPALDIGIVGDLRDFVNNAFDSIEDQISRRADLDTYTQAVNEALSAVNNALQSPGLAMDRIISLINAPAEFASSAIDRVQLFEIRIDQLRQRFVDGEEKTVAQKIAYEAQGSALLSGMAKSAITPNEGDYTKRSQVFDQVGKLSDRYDQYIADLDNFQTDTNDDPGGYAPSHDIQSGLRNTVSLSISNLFRIALGSAQERSIILETNSNPILLTHRLYGLDEEDANLEKLIRQNDLSFQEYLQIEAGRTITYLSQ